MLAGGPRAGLQARLRAFSPKAMFGPAFMPGLRRTHHRPSQLLHSLRPVYGPSRFGTGDLNWVKGYIRNQREHHARGKVHERLERTSETDA